MHPMGALRDPCFMGVSRDVFGNTCRNGPFGMQSGGLTFGRLSQGDYPAGVEYKEMTEAQQASNSSWNQVFRWYQLLQRTGTPVSFGGAGQKAAAASGGGMDVEEEEQELMAAAAGGSGQQPDAKRQRVEMQQWEPDFDY